MLHIILYTCMQIISHSKPFKDFVLILLGFLVSFNCRVTGNLSETLFILMVLVGVKPLKVLI